MRQSRHLTLTFNPVPNGSRIFNFVCNHTPNDVLLNIFVIERLNELVCFILSFISAVHKFYKPVGCSGRHSDSCGSSWTGETSQELSDKEAHRHPRGKRSAWNGNQQPLFTSRQNKTVDKIDYYPSLSTV